MEKSSIGSGLENNDGLEGRLSLWERKGERPPKKQQKFQLHAETVLTRQCHSKPGRSLKRLRRVLCLHECFSQIQGQNVDQEKIPQGQKDLDPVHLFIFHQVSISYLGLLGMTHPLRIPELEGVLFLQTVCMRTLKLCSRSHSW